MNGSKLLATANNAFGLRINTGSKAFFGTGDNQPNVIDGTAGVNKAWAGLLSEGNSVISCYLHYHKIRDCDSGLQALTGGQIIHTSNNQYSDNDTDEDATAASFGYID